MFGKNQHSDDSNGKALDSEFFGLFMKNQKNIYAYILSLVHNYVDADDIMQESTTVMWRGFEEFDQNTEFIAWGITIAHYQVLKFFKNKSRNKLQFNDKLLESIAETAASNVNSIDERLIALNDCRKKLSKRDNKLLQLKYTHGNTIRKIADDTGNSVHALYKTMGKIHNALQQCIEKTISRETI